MSITLRKFSLEQDFLNAVQNHQMTVVQDTGVFRHLLFMKPNHSDHWFQLTTWEGHLCISGDMGCYVFCRTNDMFKFFRNSALKINPSYWAEKVEAGDVYEYSSDEAKDAILASFHDWVEYKKENADESDTEFDLETTNFIAEQRDRLDSEILYESEQEHNLLHAIQHWDKDEDGFNFVDFFDGGDPLQDYNYHYIWCLFAIVWGIQQYDSLVTHKEEQTTTELYGPFARRSQAHISAQAKLKADQDFLATAEAAYFSKTDKYSVVYVLTLIVFALLILVAGRFLWVH